jgi:hypothetical protein
LVPPGFSFDDEAEGPADDVWLMAEAAPFAIRWDRDSASGRLWPLMDVLRALPASRSRPARLGPHAASSMSDLVWGLANSATSLLWHEEIAPVMTLAREICGANIETGYDGLRKNPAFRRAEAGRPVKAVANALCRDAKGFDARLAEAEIKIEFARAVAFRLSLGRSTPYPNIPPIPGSKASWPDSGEAAEEPLPDGPENPG